MPRRRRLPVAEDRLSDESACNEANGCEGDRLDGRVAVSRTARPTLPCLLETTHPASGQPAGWARHDLLEEAPAALAERVPQYDENEDRADAPTAHLLRSVPGGQAAQQLAHLVGS